MGKNLVLRTTVSTVLLLSLLTDAFSANCGFQENFERADEGGSRSVTVYRGAPVAELGGIRPLLFITSLKVNTDGTRISYHVNDVTGRRCASDPARAPCAINNIRNAYRNHHRPETDFTEVRDAGFPVEKTWRVLNDAIIEKDKSTNKPCVTPDGYLVSMTADVAVDGGFGRQGDCDQTKWIDALTAPAIVLPKGTEAVPSQFRAQGVTKRSIAVAFSRSGARRVVPAIVGDFGPVDEIGEANIALNRKLNGLAETDQPKHRADAIARFQVGRTAILLFPGNGMILGRPISGARIAEAGKSAVDRFGGADRVYKCIREEIDPNF